MPDHRVTDTRAAVESLAARMAYDAGLGASEWEAFVALAEKKIAHATGSRADKFPSGPGDGGNSAPGWMPTPHATPDRLFKPVQVVQAIVLLLFMYLAGPILWVLAIVIWRGWTP